MYLDLSVNTWGDATLSRLFWTPLSVLVQEEKLKKEGWITVSHCNGVVNKCPFPYSKWVL